MRKSVTTILVGLLVLGAATLVAQSKTYVGVATSFDSPYSFGFGWSRDSPYDAGRQAEEACRRIAGETCFNTTTTNDVVGHDCVAVVQGSWVDVNGIPGSSIHTGSGDLEWASDWATRGCESRMTSGLSADRRHREWSCTAPRTYCSWDVPAAERRDLGDDRSPDQSSLRPSFGRLAAALGLNPNETRPPPTADALPTVSSQTTPIRITSHRNGERVTSRIIEIEGEANPRAGDYITVQFADVQQRTPLANGSFQTSVVLRSGSNDIRVCQGRNCSAITLNADIEALGLMATLAWSGGGDLDLHVEDPQGQHCYFGAKEIHGACTLDIDDQYGNNPENMSVPVNASRGRYRFWVVNFANGRGSRGTLTIYRDGTAVESAPFVVNVGDDGTILTRNVTW